MGNAHYTAAPQVFGRYLLFGEIAAGGMATVHFGRLTGSVGFARTVAIKRLHPQFAKDPEFVSMFLDEARVAGRIRHPNVVPTLDVVSTDGEIFLAMDYVQGETLAKLLRAARAQGKAPSPQIIATILANVLHGLHAAHEAKDEHGRPLGIVHRDVSPQNVLVGVDGVARVLDFGVAKAAGRLQITREGQVKGKLAYMSPEQLEGGGVTRQADVYAAAVVLWETLTAQRLFDGENEAMTLVQVLEGRIAPPSQYLADLPPGTDEVVMRGVTRNPAERYQTAREMAVAIERTMGLASPAMVGEWVESVAHEELDARARHIAFMENATIGHSADSVARLLAVPQASPSGSSMPGVREPSSLSSISVSSGPPSGRRRMPRLALAAIVASVALCVVGSGLVIATQGGTQGGPSAALGNASSPVAANPVARELEIIDRGAVALLAPSAAKPAGLPVTVGFNPTSRPAPRPRGTDCSPPYTIDPATGHKKYKKNCD